MRPPLPPPAGFGRAIISHLLPFAVLQRSVKDKFCPPLHRRHTSQARPARAGAQKATQPLRRAHTGSVMVSSTNLATCCASANMPPRACHTPRRHTPLHTNSFFFICAFFSRQRLSQWRTGGREGRGGYGRTSERDEWGDRAFRCRDQHPGGCHGVRLRLGWGGVAAEGGGHAATTRRAVERRRGGGSG